MNDITPLVTTITEKCRTCYTCVRGCPAKAIRISSGQAEVIKERCIGCANCVLMCSRQAKEVRSSVTEVRTLLASGAETAICLAPSFPVEFPELDPLRFAGMLKNLGFKYVTEVAFGADMVSLKYRRLVNENPGKKYISSACPAIVSYIEKYHPALAVNLAPIVSPMLASARIVKARYGANLNIVFAGPCVAKKDEALRHPGEITGVITFRELRELLETAGVSDATSLNAHFDPPYPSKGVLYPIGGGLLTSSEFEEDLMSGKFLSTEGLENFTDALRNFEHGDMDADFLDILCCNGCLMGPGMTAKSSRYSRQASLRRYAKKSYHKIKISDWEDAIQKYRNLDYSTGFKPEDKRITPPPAAEIKAILERMGKPVPEDELNCGACGYQTCVEHATAIYRGLAESEMCLPHTIERLKITAKELASSYGQLAKTKQALLQSEKLASMGQLAAGVAHELNNPLGVVLLYSHLLADQCQKDSRIFKDAQMVTEQADRCKKIVGGLLNFARKNKPFFKKTDLRKLVDAHFKGLPIPANIKPDIVHTGAELDVEVDPDQMTQVFSNLITNAMEAMPAGGSLKISTFQQGAYICFSVADSGTGISEENKKKIFEPFFTTKQIGKGTGLGLAVSYGIIKVHKGKIMVESNADISKGATGTTFTVVLPKHAAEVRQ